MTNVLPAQVSFRKELILTIYQAGDYEAFWIDQVSAWKLLGRVVRLLAVKPAHCVRLHQICLLPLADLQLSLLLLLNPQVLQVYADMQSMGYGHCGCACIRLLCTVAHSMSLHGP